MSGVLTSLLEDVRKKYIEQMLADESEPYLTAERLCHEMLFLETDRLAEILEQDPTLLAARAGDLIMNQDESDNPSVGVIICSNIVAAALEGLLAVAVEREWLSVDDEGSILVDEAELARSSQYPSTVDYSRSETALNNVSAGGQSLLSAIFSAAEAAFIESLEKHSNEKDAYQQALDVSSNFSVFAPEDIAPLIAENPLLLGLRPEDLIDDELFEGDPPAGLIVSAHLTRMMLHQMLELGVEQGALVLDSSGHIIVPEEPDSPPVIH